MKWIARLYSKLHPQEITPLASTERSQQEATAQVLSAELMLQEVSRTTEKVTQTVVKLRDEDDNNHFGYLIESHTMRGNG